MNHVCYVVIYWSNTQGLTCNSFLKYIGGDFTVMSLCMALSEIRLSRKVGFWTLGPVDYCNRHSEPWQHGWGVWWGGLSFGRELMFLLSVILWKDGISLRGHPLRWLGLDSTSVLWCALRCLGLQGNVEPTPLHGGTWWCAVCSGLLEVYTVISVPFSDSYFTKS